MLKDYRSIYDFVINHTQRTQEGLIKIVEGGKERFLGGDKLEDYCSRLREMVDLILCNNTFEQIKEAEVVLPVKDEIQEQSFKLLNQLAEQRRKA